MCIGYYSRKLFTLLLALISSLFSTSVQAQPWSENFDSQTSGTYGTGNITINGRVWSRSNAGNFSYANTSMGSYAFTINDDIAGAHITSPVLNTCGTVSFSYAYINGNSTNVFQLQKSTDGTTFTTIDTRTLGASSNLSYVSYSFSVNETNSTTYIRVLSDNQNAHLFIEDFSVTAFTPSGPDNPDAFSATASSSSQIDLAVTANGNGDNVLIAWNSTGTFGTPVDGSTYTAGNTIAGGGTVLYYGPAAGAPDHTGLTANTQYFYSAWSYDGAEYSFGLTDDATTFCDVVALPFSEGFEGGVVPPTCWASFRGTNGLGTTLDWEVTTTANSGSYAARVQDENVTGGLAEDWLVTPALDFSNAANDYELTFYGRDYFSTDYSTTFRVLVSTTSQTSHAAFSTVATYTEAAMTTTYNLKTVDLSAYAGSATVYVAFVSEGDYDDEWYIDDINIVSIPPSACSGQMSGTYTINASLPASCTNYQDFASAVSDMILGSRTDDNGFRHDGGISGPVVFEVAPGTYYEQISIVEIPGASTTNTVTFRSATLSNGDVMLTVASQNSSTPPNYVLQLAGADHIRFEHITLRRTGTFNYARVVEMNGDASDNIFDNCYLLVEFPNGQTSDIAALVLNESSDVQTGNIIRDCWLENGSIGVRMDCSNGSDWTGFELTDNWFSGIRGDIIYLDDVAAPVITGNLIEANSGTSGNDCIQIRYCDGASNVSGNVIESSGSGVGYAIYYYYSPGSHSIRENYIFGNSGTIQYGLYMLGSGATGSNGLIANNSIRTVNGSSSSYPVYLSSSEQIDVWNNTLFVAGGTSSTTYAIYSNGTTDGASLRNNVLVNAGTGTGSSNNQIVSFSSATVFSAGVSDNAYYTSNTGTPFRAYYAGTYTDFATYIAAIGETGTPQNVDPLMSFVGGRWKATETSLTNGCPQLSGIALDIDGLSRYNPTTIGAHENGTGTTPPVADFSASSTNTCVATTVTFTDGTINTPTSWAWSFSPSTVTYVGGTNASSQNPQVQFNASGLYEVTLTATNADGSDDEVKTDYIAVGLSGTYTIGGTTPDYATFTDAVTELNAIGVCGPVVFDVRTDVYTEQISINQFTGSSATNTVTFQSETGTNTDVTLNFASSGSSGDPNYVLQFNGCDYVTFQNMTIERTGSNNYSRVIDVSGDASYNTITGNILLGRVSTPSTAYSDVIFSDDANSGNEGNTVSNNIITGGYTGINWEGSSGLMESNLTISGNTFQCYRYGMYLRYINDVVITGNTITNPTSFNGPATQGIYAFHLDRMLTVTFNSIALKSGTNVHGMELLSCEGNGLNVGLVANNMVSVGSSSSESTSGAGDGTGTTEGIYMNGTTYKNFYYNSWLSTSTNPTTGRAFYLNGPSNANIALRNNIFAQNGGGYAFYNSIASAISTTDYNNYYSPGGLFGYWSGAVADLAALQTANSQDANSAEVDPGFVSNTDLHVLAGSGIDGLATVLSITDDIDGDARDGITPDMGADEYDNTLPIVTLDADVNTGTEAAGTVITLTATASFAVTGDQTVDLAITGTGVTGTDYTLSGVTITIPDGQTTGSVTFTVLNDTDAEGPEVATATISNPTAGIVISVAYYSEDIAIVDDDQCELEDFDGGDLGSGGYSSYTYTKNAGAIEYACSGCLRDTPATQDGEERTHNGSTYALRLQDSGTSEFTAKLTDGGMGVFSAWIRRWDDNADPTYTVEYSVDNGSNWNSVITLNNAWFGTSAFKELTFSVNASSSPSNSADDIIVRIARVSGERIIIDDITWGCYALNPVVSLGISPTSGTETDETTITLTATADSPVSGDQTVDVYISSGGTASDFYNGADFTGTVTITILDGQTAGTITFDVYDDSDIEGDETVTFSLTNPASGLNLDIPANISVDFDITDNDNLTSYESVIVEQGGEIATISSLVNGSISSVSDGVQVWTFRLYDGDGATNDADALPTIYSGWTIRASAGNQVPDWGLAIDDLAFFDGSTELSSGGILISGSSITFSFVNPADNIIVPDGGYVEVDMRLTLEASLPSGSDGQHFGFSIDAVDVQVDSDLLSSSQLGTFTETSDAAQNEISIIGTLQFIDAPAGVTLGSNFSATVSVVDANGNVDTDVTNSITLTLSSGTGTLTGVPVTANLINGTYTFTGLNHDTEEVIEIMAHDNGNVYSDLTASIIVSDLPHQLFDDFNRATNNVVGIPSSETVLAYSEAGTGNGTRTRVEANQLLLANCDNGESNGGNNGMEQVMFDVAHRFETTYDNAGSTMEWTFNMNQSRTNPSGFGSNTYAAAVILGSDESDVTSVTADGYAVVIGHSGSTPDYVKLIRFSGGLTTDGNTTDVALSTESDADSHYSVKVVYNPCNGEWSLEVRDDGGSYADPNVGGLGTPVTATDQTHTALDLKYFGYIWQHGTSCTETATFDNVSIPNAVGGTPPTGFKVWNGSVNTDWHVAGNWGPCEGVPTMSDDVLIPNTTNKPHIFPTMIGLCNRIKVETDNGAKLTIENTGKLRVHLP